MRLLRSEASHEDCVCRMTCGEVSGSSVPSAGGSTGSAGSVTGSPAAGSSTPFSFAHLRTTFATPKARAAA